MKEGISVRWLNGQNFHYLLKVFLRSVFEVVVFLCPNFLPSVRIYH